MDDDIDGCELVSAILGGRGARVHCAASGRDALHLLAQRPFDLIVSDIGMPDMDGYELIRRVRKREEQSSRRTLAIAISAYAGSEDRQRALLRGYQMHMSKSIEALELIAAVASVRHPTPS